MPKSIAITRREPRSGWERQAECRNYDPDLFMMDEEDNGWVKGEAKAVCMECPVRLDCLLQSGIEEGGTTGARNYAGTVRAGMSPHARGTLLRSLGLQGERDSRWAATSRDFDGIEAGRDVA